MGTDQRVKLEEEEEKRMFVFHDPRVKTINFLNTIGRVWC
jgi:hypothetical protein